jgi:hypothetical protein
MRNQGARRRWDSSLELMKLIVETREDVWRERDTMHQAAEDIVRGETKAF